MDQDKQNAAPTAMGDGASNSEKAGQPSRDSNLKPTRSTMVLYAKPAHKRVIMALGYALILGEFDAWVETRDFFASYLSMEEHVHLAYHALKTLPNDIIENMALAILGRTGGPLPTFISLDDDAVFWASMAPTCELKAYTLAAFKYLPRYDQIKLLAQLNEEVG